MQNETTDRHEQRLRFVARRYREGSLDADAAWKCFAAKQGIRRNFPIRRLMAGVAVVLLAVVGFGSIWFMQQSRPEWVVVATQAGEVKDVWLPDSSLLSLAEHSQVRYDKRQYGKERRAVQMSGKTFFRVRRDEARPFSVQTARTEVVVLGTAFQLSEQTTGQTALYVESGKVSFAATAQTGQEPVVLTKGMSAVYSVDTDKITVTKEEEPNILAWRTRQYTFDNTPLDRVIRTLSDSYQVRILPKSTPAPGLKLTASFDDMPLTDILSIINQTLDTDLRAYPVHIQQ